MWGGIWKSRVGRRGSEMLSIRLDSEMERMLDEVSVALHMTKADIAREP
jgi:predicted DNA-binding protein